MGKVRRSLLSAAGVWAKVSFTSSNQNVPLISRLPGTRITLTAISRACGPVAKLANSFRQPLVLSRSSVLANTRLP
jgi:hypothetical protein